MSELSPAEDAAVAETEADPFELGGRSWRSRLIVGTGGFRSLGDLERALSASGTEIVDRRAAAGRSAQRRDRCSR